jgi:acetylornithine deacetylase/succinyl-diaminopimelate desuccinylase-like protein
LIFFADEEASGTVGSKWLVEHHPEFIADCDLAIGEVGGFSVTIRDDLRLYLIETAEKGFEWLRLIADGTAGHGSMRNSDNPVTELAGAIARIGAYQWPVHLHPAQLEFIAALEQALGVKITADNAEETLASLGSVARMVGAAMSNTANPTMLDAGYLVNVIPSRAEAQVDARFIPGFRDELVGTINELIGPKVRTVPVSQRPSVETEFAGDLVDAMRAALLAEDPGAKAVPYLLSAGTDAKNFAAELGVRCFGFTPLKLPPELDFNALFHGVDERIPIDSLRFGARVLDHFLDLA